MFDRRPGGSGRAVLDLDTLFCEIERLGVKFGFDVVDAGRVGEGVVLHRAEPTVAT